MKEKPKFSIAEGSYVPPRTCVHFIEIEMPILTCSTDHFNGVTPGYDESVQDFNYDGDIITIP